MSRKQYDDSKRQAFFVAPPTSIFEIRDVLQHILSFMHLQVVFDDHGKIKQSDFLSILTCFKAFHFALINFTDFQKRFNLLKKLDLSSRISKPPSLLQSVFLRKVFDIPLSSEIFKQDYDLVDAMHNRLKLMSITTDEFITDDEVKKIINLQGTLRTSKMRVKTKPLLFEFPSIFFLTLSLGAGFMSYLCGLSLLSSVKNCGRYDQVMIDAIYPACSNTSFIADFSLTAGLSFIVSSGAFLFAMDTVKKDYKILCQKMALYENHSSLFKKADAIVEYLQCESNGNALKK